MLSTVGLTPGRNGDCVAHHKQKTEVATKHVWLGENPVLKQIEHIMSRSLGITVIGLDGVSRLRTSRWVIILSSLVRILLCWCVHSRRLEAE